MTHPPAALPAARPDAGTTPPRPAGPAGRPELPGRHRTRGGHGRFVAAERPALVVATADPSLARMLGFALDQVRLPHELFTSGTDVLQALLAVPPQASPPIVVLDVDLPGVDGHAILERLGVERPNAFLILVISSHADESVQVRSLLAGAFDHLAKPFNVRVLVAKLQRWTALAAGIRKVA
ncbi:MAG: response regulator [Vicinamibacterales bacterium]